MESCPLCGDQLIPEDDERHSGAPVLRCENGHRGTLHELLVEWDKLAHPVVTEAPPLACPLCGKPRGTGSLLDAYPDPPPLAIPGPLVTVSGLFGSRVSERGMSVEVWREFAVKYRCPACADA